MSAAAGAEVELTADQQAELDAATEVAALVRRVLDGARTFPPGHKTLVGYYATLHERLTALLNGPLDLDELSLGVTPLGFKLFGRVMNPAESLGDSFTHALFLDGVHQLVFSKGLTASDLETLIAIWRATLDGKLGDTHTFCTRFWEADLQTVHVLAVETFSEGATSEGKQKSELQVVVDTLSSGGGGYGGSTSSIAGTSGIYSGSVSRVSRITRNDLEQLRAQGMPDLTDQDLARFDATERARVESLSPAELTKLAEDLAARTAQQIERATDALFQSGIRASPEELLNLRRAFSLVLSAMVKAGLLARMREVLTRRVVAAREGDVNDMAARFEVLGQLMGSLVAPVVLEPLVAALDDEAQAPHALAVLRFLPGGASSVLLSWLSLPEKPAARRALSDAIVAHAPSAEELKERMGWADEETALELLHIANALGVEASWPVRKVGLAHPSPAVRRAAVSNLPKELVLAHKAELAPLLASPDPDIRGPLFAPFIAAKEPTAAPALGTLLRRVKVDDAERRRVIVALGTLGGSEACGVLRSELTQAKDEELKLACINALAHAGDEKARPLLEEAAGKLLGGGEVKKAAQAALKRLDFLKKAGGGAR
ncbi:MAG: HEAT repeat domain-containing protein [Myxococcota bacterium]